MSKINALKIAVLLFLLGQVIYWSSNIAPMVTADMAVTQLQDSDGAYLGFKFTQKLPQIMWGVWFFLAGLMYRKQIIKLFKGDK